MKALLAGVLMTSIVTVAHAQQPIRVAVELRDSTRILQSALAAALRNLGDIDVVTTAEPHEIALSGIAVCFPTCRDHLSYSLALNVAESISKELMQGTSVGHRLLLEGAHVLRSVFVFSLGRNRYEQGIREWVAEFDSSCLEAIRIRRRLGVAIRNNDELLMARLGDHLRGLGKCGALQRSVLSR